MTEVAAPATNTRAILMMILAILCFTIMDASVKALTPRVGVLPAIWARYAGQMLVVILLVLPKLRSVIRTKNPGLHLLRSLMLGSATAFFFAALNQVPLTEASALMAVNPVLITLGASLFLGEKLGPRRIGGIVASLIGAMIIIRPGSDVFQAQALFALAAAVCYSAYALLTRRVGPAEDIWTSLFYTGLVGTAILSAAVPIAWVPPDGAAIILMIAVACAGTVGQLFLIRAFSSGEAAMLAPYSYTGLIFASVWGMLFFGEFPDAWTLCGALVIAASGLYVWHRETFRS